MSDYLCMSADELALWRGQASRSRSSVPCRDCPLWFAQNAYAEGKCHRPMGARPVGSRGPAQTHHTFEEQRAALRVSWRESKRRQRAKGVQ